ncbi:MAG: TonB-dependent receptor [Cytophagales bacterium]|nr:TonB-dependent receptor [Cytophagales bacterium]
MKKHFYVALILFLVAANAYARIVIQGYVTDAETKKPIAGVNVYAREVKKGVTTDDKGYYSIVLPTGAYTLVFSSVGYRFKVETVNSTENVRMDIELLSQTKQLEEVIVTGKTIDHNVKDVQMSAVSLDLLNIKKIPVAFGEPDVIRTLTFQAGVSTVGEGAGGFNVRGGRVDQNLVLLDGAPLFNTSHLLGFFTNVNSDAIREANLYKGSFSAQYGGRVSSLLLIETKSGNEEKWDFAGGVSPLSSRFSVGGPVAKNKLTVYAGGRAAYPNWLIRTFPSQNVRNSRAFFYDLNGKILYRINERNQITLTGYRSYDNFKFPGDTLYGWQSNVGVFRWAGFLNKNFSWNVSALHSGYAYQVEGLTESYTFQLASSIRHREVKADFTYKFNDALKLDFGANHIWYTLQLGDQKPVGDNSSIIPRKLQPENARERAVYVNGEWLISPTFTIQAGLRYSLFAQTGPKSLAIYENGVPRSEETVIDTVFYSRNGRIQNYGGIEPRLGLRVGLGENNALKLSYNRTRQYIHLISNTTAITPIDFWKISDPFIRPQIADQFAAGFFKNLKDNAIETSVEVFYKNIDNLIEYKDGASLILNPIIEADLLRATGRAYGVELSIAKNRGRLTGNVNYTFSRSLVAVQTPFAEERINAGAYYPSNFDKPHIVNLQALYALGRNWTFSANFVYSTGRPATFPDGLYVIDERPALGFSRRNADRIPDYHRLDISFSKDTRRSREQSKYAIVTVGFYNVYARKNPYSIYFVQNVWTRSYRLAVFGSIIPSVTYNFHF